jgi:hypothetical protein
LSGINAQEDSLQCNSISSVSCIVAVVGAIDVVDGDEEGISAASYIK